MNENAFLEHFHRCFASLRGKRVVLYGVGIYTKLLLERVQWLSDAGVADSRCAGQELYGRRILSDEEAAGRAQVILIVSSLSVAGMVYRRIKPNLGGRCAEVYYLNGARPAVYDDAVAALPCWGFDGDALRRQILQCDVVSFDLFDTLLLRACAHPADLFDSVGRALLREGLYAPRFPAERTAAEKYCYSRCKHFTLEMVYDHLAGLYGWDSVQRERALETELSLELRFAAPREGMGGWMAYAKSQGKTVLIATDTALQEGQLLPLLKKCGVTGYDRLLVSCGVRRNKSDGQMFSYMRALYPGRRILHIGDDPHSDVRMARENRVQAFPIMSARALYESTGLAKAFSPPRARDDALVQGLLMKKCFSDPFAVHARRGKIGVERPEDFGYLFFGPMVLQFLVWLMKQSRRQGKKTLLFVSRDGYLLKELYDLLRDGRDGFPDSLYFLSSRRASSVAAMDSAQDARFILEKLCNTASLTFEGICTRFYGVAVHPGDPLAQKTLAALGKERIWQAIDREYLPEILQNARRERDGYQAYLRTLPIADACPGFVNFVCRGTTQRFVSKLLRRPVAAYYFAAQEDLAEMVDPRTVNALYGLDHSPHTSRLQLMAHYLVGETVLTAQHGQISHFDASGKPVYAACEGRDFSPVRRCQDGIRAYVREMSALLYDILDLRVSGDYCDSLFGGFALPHFELSRAVRDGLAFYDETVSPDASKLLA